MNVLSCPIEMFNSRWHSEFTSLLFQRTRAIDKTLSSLADNGQDPECNHNQTAINRTSELSVMAKDIIARCVFNDSTYELVKTNFASLQDLIHLKADVEQKESENKASERINNHLKVKTKGQAKETSGRIKSIGELQRQKRKKPIQVAGD